MKKNLKSMLFLRKGKAKLEGATWWVVLWNAFQVHRYRVSWVSLKCRSMLSELVSGLGPALCIMTSLPGDVRDADPRITL